MPARTRSQRRAEFVRGFFLHLRQQQIPSAVLHGGEDGFEGELSDVDFVTDEASFRNLPSLIHSYCVLSGWQLCQVLRHETTAAYCVCSASDDPACAVALDGCSDYQRNGTLFLGARALLENPRSLAWGGAALASNVELRYRFVKAAAKHKDAGDMASEFSRYSENVRQDCETWLMERWGIGLANWDTDGLATAFRQLRAKSNPKPPLLRLGSLARIARRISHPTGMVVITGAVEFTATAALLESVFGHLYFRRFLKADRFRPLHFKDLIASTLIVVPELGFPEKLIPTDCLHRLDSAQDPVTQCQDLAEHLHQRCWWRETR